MFALKRHSCRITILTRTPQIPRATLLVAPDVDADGSYELQCSPTQTKLSKSYGKTPSDQNAQARHACTSAVSLRQRG